MNNKQETIERYLRQEMNDEELKNFTFQMVMNPNLRKEIEKTRIIFKTLKTQPNPPKAIGNHWILVSLLVIIIAGGIYFLIGQSENSIEKTEETIPTENRPIAQTDLFEPNQYFEELITRQTGFVLDIQNKVNEEFSSAENQAFVFQLNADLSGENIPKNLILSIWSNQMDDFENNQPIFSDLVEIDDQNKINFQKELDISQGLFYYIFTLPKSDEPINSGKFILRKK